MLLVFCSSDFIVALKTGPSSEIEVSSFGRGQDTSTLIASFAWDAEGEPIIPRSCAGAARGERTSSCSGTVAMRDSNDCEDATRILGGALRRTGGTGELGWLR